MKPREELIEGRGTHIHQQDDGSSVTVHGNSDNDAIVELLCDIRDLLGHIVGEQQQRKEGLK